MEGTRIDKWLWATRFFKTRQLASKACELGRVRSNNQLAKASREVRVGDRLHVTTEGGAFEIDVLELSEVRGAAAVAQTLYRETETSKQLRAEAAEQRRQMAQFETLPAAKPTGRDRRVLQRFRGRG